MTWIYIAIVGQFFNAIVAILDKYIVSDEKLLPRPFVYAFYSCLLTGAWIAVYFVGSISWLNVGSMLPSFENIERPTLIVISLSLLAAYTFFFALVSMFNSLKSADTSDVVPVIGAISILSSLGLSYYFLESVLTEQVIVGVVLLSFGTFLVSQNRLSKPVVLYTLHAGLFFALHNITMKELFNLSNFDNAFFWSRVGLILFALSLLLVPSYLGKITEQTAVTTTRAGFIVLINKVLAGIAAFLLLRAVDMGNVTVVQALDGIKYVILLLIAVFFGKLIPTSAGENDTRPEHIARKVIYVAIISTGFFVLLV